MKYFAMSLVMAAVVSLSVVGCSDSEVPTVDDTPVADTAQEGKAAQEDADQKKIDEALATLSAEDAESAKAQGDCPVSGEALGTMGTPIKLEVQDQQVWICCEGCREKIEANPEEFLAKLKQ